MTSTTTARSATCSFPRPIGGARRRSTNRLRLGDRGHYPDFTSPGLIGEWVEDRPTAPKAGPVIWLAVTDMDEALALVTTHGGQILTPPAPDGPTRILATIADPEGNPVGLAAHVPS